jgi:hypothetical protein
MLVGGPLMKKCWLGNTWRKLYLSESLLRL